MSKFLERVRDRNNARRLRRRLTPEQRIYADRLAAEIWSETGDIGQAEEYATRTLQSNGGRLGFDPTTILLIIQFLILVFKVLKELNVLAPTAETVTAIFESEDGE